MREERDTAKLENSQLKDELAAKDSFIDNLKSKLEEKEKAIAKLKSELEAREEVKQLSFFPEPEPTPIPTPETETETENTESPAVNSQPSTVNPKPSRGTTKPKLLTAGELVKWISDKHPEKKPVEYHNLRDWFKKNSTCSDKKRAEVQEEYGFKFSHCDKKGTLWFTVG